jgi:hypothetical protein
LLLSDELLELAATALAAGLDSTNLRQLAGELHPSWASVGALFDGVLRDLSIELPARREAGFALARHYAEQILNGQLTPYDGAPNIWRHVGSEFHEDPEIWGTLVSFVGLASEWEDHAGSRDECEQQIIEEAQRLIERTG